MSCLTARVLALSLSDTEPRATVACVFFGASSSTSDTSLAFDSVVSFGEGTVLGGEGVALGS